MGKGEYLVVEADESDGFTIISFNGSFDECNRDHLENFNGDFALLHNCFNSLIAFYGIAFICFDDPNAMSIIKELNARHYLWQGPGVDYIHNLEHRDGFEILI